MMTSTLRHIVVAVALGAGFSGACANSYTIVDLGRRNEPMQINAQGEMAGAVVAPGELQKAIARRGAHWHDLPSDGNRSWGSGINAHGDVAGTLVQASTPTAVVWPRSGGRLAVALPDEATYGFAYGIAADGTVVGAFSPAGGNERCFLTTPDGQSTDLGMMGHGYACEAVAINASHQVAGSVFVDANADERAFLWQDGKFRNLGLLPGSDSAWANALNARGHVVGAVAMSGAAHAFFWSDGAMKDLEPAHLYDSSTAYGINDSGVIVGTGYRYSDNRSHALRFDHGQAVDLEQEVVDLGAWRLQWANSVNGKGVIVGFGHLGMHTHGFMLVPQAEH